MNISILDLILGIILLFFGFLGFKKGFAKQLSTLLTFLLTVLAIYYAYPIFLKYLASTFVELSKAATLAIGLSALALLSIGLFVILNQILSTGIASNISDNSNKGLGFLLGLIRGSLLLIIIFTIAMHINEKAVHKGITKKSVAGKWFGKSFYKDIKKHLDRKNIEQGINILNERVEWPSPSDLIE